jgi:hypothetical protein
MPQKIDTEISSQHEIIFRPQASDSLTMVVIGADEPGLTFCDPLYRSTAVPLTYCRQTAVNWAKRK